MIYKVFDNSKQHLDNHDIARILLTNAMGKAIANPEKHPSDIYAMTWHYLKDGQIARQHYVTLVNYYIEDEDIRRDLHVQ